MAVLERDGKVVVALSYDPVDVLARFSRSRDIEYPLLSDVGSRVIERLGLLHEGLTERLGLYPVRTDHPRYQRVPYPGTFIVDRSGIVIDKVFEQHHLIRRTTDWFVSTRVEERIVARGASGPVRIALSLSDDTYRPTQKVMLRAEVRVAPGYHLYADPAPEGMAALRVAIDPSADVSVDHELPRPTAEVTDELGHRSPAHEGVLAWPIGIVVSKNLGDVPLRARFAFQACSETMCEPPDSIELALTLRGQDHIAPAAGQAD